jgi:WD40 repeat protein
VNSGVFWVQLWDLQKGTKLRTLRGHTKKLTCLAISPDGSVLASGGQDDFVRQWRLPDGEELSTVPVASSLGVTSLAFSPDNEILVTAGGSKVELWGVPDGFSLAELNNPAMLEARVAISPDGKILAATGLIYLGDNRIRLWNLPEGTQQKTLNAHKKGITCVAISPDSTILASGSWDKTVRLWSLPDGNLLATLEGHSRWIACIAISPDGRILASGGWDSDIRLWSVPAGKLLMTLKGHTKQVTCTTFNPSGDLLISGSRDKTARLWTLWKVEFHRLLTTPTGVEDPQWIVAVLQNERVTGIERAWLEFTQRLMLWQRRFDIDIGQPPTDIPRGEFDIELET